MPPNRHPSTALLADIARLRADLREEACRARAQRMVRQVSAEGRMEFVRRLRAARARVTHDPRAECDVNSTHSQGAGIHGSR